MEENETKIVNFDRICRLCLSEKRLLMEIFESCADSNLTIDQKIMACASIDLAKDDGLPARICVKCLSSVNAAFEFRLQCENADKTLHNIHSILIINESDAEKKEKVTIKDNVKIENEGEQFQVEEVVHDLNHIIVIKQEEKDSVREQKSSNQLFIINNSKKENEKEVREKVLGDNVIYFNQGEFGSDNSLGPPPFQTNEMKENSEMAGEISFGLQGDERESYKVVFVPPEDAEEATKLKGTKKKRGDTLKKSPCPFCNKMLTRVEDHVRLFHRNKVYMCSKINCGAEFLTLKNLQSHQLKCYEMKKDYKCPSCFKEFHRKSNFTAHVRRHGGKKNFQCLLCERAFVDSTGLRRHFLKHHEPEQEVFISGCCGKRFKSKEGLKKHIRNGVCGIHIFQVSDSDEISVQNNESIVCIQTKVKESGKS